MEQTTFRCENCGGVLEYNPGVSSLECPYCGTVNAPPAEKAPEVYEELDFEEARAIFAAAENSEEVQILACGACGAEVTLAGNATTAECDFCGTHIVAEGKGTRVMKPQYILPFTLEKSDAKKEFRRWLKKRWFAPNALKKLARITDSLKGIYYPFWTFDSQTSTDYRGERGENYTVEVKDGDSTRTETRTRWYPARGHVARFFNDLLIAAGRSLPEKLTRRLDLWNLDRMLTYNEVYLSGFKAEAYSRDIEECFGEAKEIMETKIRGDVRRDIGGDHQRIHRLDTAYSGITFKYIILPVWTLTYKFRKNYYQVLINGQTGEVEGTRPYSFWKIFGLILFVAAVGAAIYIASLVRGQ